MEQTGSSSVVHTARHSITGQQTYNSTSRVIWGRLVRAGSPKQAKSVVKFPNRTIYFIPATRILPNALPNHCRPNSINGNTHHAGFWWRLFRVRSNAAKSLVAGRGHRPPNRSLAFPFFRFVFPHQLKMHRRGKGAIAVVLHAQGEKRLLVPFHCNVTETDTSSRDNPVAR